MIYRYNRLLLKVIAKTDSFILFVLKNLGHLEGTKGDMKGSESGCYCKA